MPGFFNVPLRLPKFPRSLDPAQPHLAPILAFTSVHSALVLYNGISFVEMARLIFSAGLLSQRRQILMLHLLILTWSIKGAAHLCFIYSCL